MKPLVTIIIPSYNHKKFIEKALDSVFAQSYKNIEVIVIDDCSTDGSQDLIRTIQKKNPFKFIARTSNYYSANPKKGDKPIIEAMNIANGKYIAIVDSDDYILPGKISTQVALLEKYPEASLCYGGIQVITEDNNRYKYIENFANGNHFDYLLVNGNPLLYIGCLIRTSAFNSIERSHPDLQQEDWDMFLKLAKCGPFVSDKETVACYRRHGNNSWFRSDREQLMYLNRMLILDTWQHESSWPEAMDIRWQQYLNKQYFNSQELDLLLSKRPYDALLHFLKFRALSAENSTELAQMHLSMAILNCDARLKVLPELYKIKIAVTESDEEKINIIKEMKNRIISTN